MYVYKSPHDIVFFKDVGNVKSMLACTQYLLAHYGVDFLSILAESVRHFGNHTRARHSGNCTFNGARHSGNRTGTLYLKSSVL